MRDKSEVVRQHRDNRMEHSMVIVAALFIHPGREREFEQFETAAESIMHRHRGRLERRIGFPPTANAEQPHEVHILTFPDEASFARYRADADLQALAELRTRAIRHTTIWIGSDLGSFIKS
jgi:uncharacterized protein (DUF1330 family)